MDNLQKYRQELEGTIYNDPEEIELYAYFKSEGMADIGAIEMLNSFGIEQIKLIKRFVKFYRHYF